jgi:hypothetical protein
MEEFFGLLQLSSLHEQLAQKQGGRLDFFIGQYNRAAEMGNRRFRIGTPHGECLVVGPANVARAELFGPRQADASLLAELMRQKDHAQPAPQA